MAGFENDVNRYGTQTTNLPYTQCCPFENDVNRYGTQTNLPYALRYDMFENDVNRYGTQTHHHAFIPAFSLRMM